MEILRVVGAGFGAFVFLILSAGSLGLLFLSYMSKVNGGRVVGAVHIFNHLLKTDDSIMNTDAHRTLAVYILIGTSIVCLTGFIATIEFMLGKSEFATRAFFIEMLAILIVSFVWYYKN